jgi:hypothetical protein
MENVRNKINDWSNITYGQMLEQRIQSCRYGSGPEIEMTRKVLAAQSLTNKPMNGNSTMGLSKMEAEVGTFKYVKVFNAISRAKDWSPVDMVFGTCYLAMKDPNVSRKAEQFGMSTEELISKMCGRALRALPSYIREHDLKCQLQERIPDAKFVQSEELDTILHADLMMEHNGSNYYFWSFVDTPQSIRNFEDKFMGHRAGHVPDGFHVTCPFSLTWCDEIDGWKLYDGVSIDQIAQIVFEPTHGAYDAVDRLLESNYQYFETPHLIDKNAGERQIQMGTQPHAKDDVQIGEQTELTQNR